MFKCVGLLDVLSEDVIFSPPQKVYVLLIRPVPQLHLPLLVLQQCQPLSQPLPGPLNMATTLSPMATAPSVSWPKWDCSSMSPISQCQKIRYYETSRAQITHEHQWMKHISVHNRIINSFIFLSPSSDCPSSCEPESQADGCLGVM